MSDFRGAYFVVGGTSFASVVVRQAAVSSDKSKEEVSTYYGRFFPQVPIVLAMQSSDGRLTFWGRKDLVGYLANNATSINWCNYSTD